MALSYSVPVGTILFYRYENCFVFMPVGAEAFEIPRRLLHDSAAWIRAWSVRLFPDIIDLYLELNIEIRVLCDLICVLFLRCGACGTRAERRAKAEKWRKS
jgi:hypothetical protein